MSATTEGAVQAPPAASAESKRFMDKVLRVRELALLIILLVLVLGADAGNRRFLGAQGVRDLLLNATILVIVGVGEAAVVITRNVDLSVGSTVGIAAFATGKYLQGGGHTVLAIGLAILIGAGIGLLNGALVSFGKVPSLVVTLGTLFIIRGVDSIWVSSREIVAHDLPVAFVELGRGGPFFLPYLAAIALAVLLVVGFYLRSYRSGREFYAIGSNPEAARLAGIPVRLRTFGAYVLCGALAGLGGSLYLATFGNVDSNTGFGYELAVVSAVVVGGVAFTGGLGSVWGAALGALLLTTIDKALPALGVGSSWENAIHGSLLLAAIAVDRLLALRVARTLRRRSVRRGR
jgi:rhamnose transport system permease protein